MDSLGVYSHSRTRTASSNTFPIQQPTPMHLTQPQQQPGLHTRRSPSVNTFSTTSTAPPPNYRTSPTNDLRRSGSSRSGGTIAQPSGYVALLRKQKATVWCDRSQYEDPRLLAAQRAAKMRAAMEVVGGQRTTSGGLAPSSGRTATGVSTTGKMAAKIRHHGKPAVVGYAPGETHVGVGGVPMRLSATEVEAESSDDDDAAAAATSSANSQHQHAATTTKPHHRRTGSSGRSSTASRRGLAYRTSGGGAKWSPGHTPERTSSIVEEPRGGEATLGDGASGKARSTASGSSAERADGLGELGGGTATGAGGAQASNAARLASNSLLNAALTREKSVKNPEELRRRGSVDERTTTLTNTGRLYIANPD